MAKTEDAKAGDAKAKAKSATVTMVNLYDDKPTLGFGHGDSDYRPNADGSFDIASGHVEIARSHGLKIKGEKTPERVAAAGNELAFLREQNARLIEQNGAFAARLEALEKAKK